MSEPKTTWNNPIAGAIFEAISASSALNMEPSPINGANGIYLSEVDAMAKHAQEHLHVAIQLMGKAQKEVENLVRGIEYILSVYHNREMPVEVMIQKEGTQGAVEWTIQQLSELRQEFRATI